MILSPGARVGARFCAPECARRTGGRPRVTQWGCWGRGVPAPTATLQRALFSSPLATGAQSLAINSEPAASKTVPFPGKSLRLTFRTGYKSGSANLRRHNYIPSSAVTVAAAPAVRSDSLQVPRQTCWTPEGQLGGHSLYSIGLKNNSLGCTRSQQGRHLRL